MTKGIRRSCKYYDWGDTAPSAYGAFCKLQQKCLDGKICKNCPKYKQKPKDKRNIYYEPKNNE